MNSPKNFVHLRALSALSIRRGLLLPEELARLAAQHGQPAIALTDLDTTMGMVRFQKAADAAGVRPIFGIDLAVEDDVTGVAPADGVMPPPPSRVVLLCENMEGYHNLLALSTRAHLENARGGLPRLRESWLDAETTRGLVVLLGGTREGLLPDVWRRRGPEAAARVAAWYGTQFPDRAAIEVQRIGQPEESAEVAAMVAASQATGVPLVATHAILFADRSDFAAHEVREAAAMDQRVHDPDRKILNTREQFFPSTEQMQELFSDIPVALENASILAARCSAHIELGKVLMPRSPDAKVPEDELVLFRKQCQEGLTRRLEAIFPDPAERARHHQEYVDRLAHEMRVIENMGFVGYFLVVADVASWSKSQGIAVGPGRGSAAGSLVAYALQITSLDPIANDLLFERFLNPERVSMPDIDTDIEMARRGEVIDYIHHRYGQAAQISTLGFQGAKAAINQAGKVLDIPFVLRQDISKMLDAAIIDQARAEHAAAIPRLLEQSEPLRRRYENEPVVRELMDRAAVLEGIPNVVGQHAGGIVIAPGKVSDVAAMHLADGNPTTDLDKDDVEAVGLIKFDFLGLKNLTTLRLMREMAMAHRRPDQSEIPPLDDLPLDDPAVYRVFATGDTIGVFQFASSGMAQYLSQLKPQSFGDLVAMNALYRPGPMNMIPEFIERRHGRAMITYPHPDLEPVLRSTYGIIVYQEQVMQIAQVMAGYSLGQADLLRRAMGKKKAEAMAEERKRFEAGAAARGVPAATARQVFDLMEKFAAYGFNRSHAAAYSQVAYQTAWMKAHYPAIFYACLINTEDKAEKIRPIVRDARRHGIKVLPPDLNESGIDASVMPDGNIRLGLASVKSVTPASAQAIMALRSQHPFRDMEDVFVRLAKINKTVVRSLVKAGAMDGIDANRAAWMDNMEVGAKYASARLKQITAAANVADDMNALLPEANRPTPVKPKKTKKQAAPPACPEWSSPEPWSVDVQYSNEVEVLGLSLTANPYPVARTALGGLSGVMGPSDSAQAPMDGYASFVGVVSGIRKIPKAKMAVVTLSDGDGELDVVMYARTWAEVEPACTPGSFIWVRGRVKRAQSAPSHDEEDASLDDVEAPIEVAADAVLDFQALRARTASLLHLRVPGDPATIDALGVVLDAHAAQGRLASPESPVMPVTLAIDEPNRPGASWVGNWRGKVHATPEVWAACERLLGRHAVSAQWRNEPLPLPRRSRAPNEGRRP